jgi:hypothetical protein
MVRNNQPEGAIHIFDGSHLTTIWRKGLLQVFGSMDFFGVNGDDHQEQLQLGRDNLKTIKHLYTAGSDTEGRRSTNFLHGFVPS